MPQIRFEYPVHELVDPAIEKNGFRVKHCDVPVHHYGFLDQKNVDEKGKQYHTIGKTKLHQMKNDPKAIQELAVQASLVGDYDGAINLWRQLVKIQPKNIKAYINLSAAYGKIGDYRKAKSAALKAIKMSPKTKEGRLNLGRSEFFLGRFDEACMVFDKLVRSNGNYYSAIFMLGASQICCGDSDKGISTIYRLKTLKIWKSLPHAVKELAGLLTSAGFEANANDLLVSLSNLGIVQKESSIDPVSAGSSHIGNSQATLPLAS
jgi:tetratricopeptide (TPR) repeat protein